MGGSGCRRDSRGRLNAFCVIFLIFFVVIPQFVPILGLLILVVLILIVRDGIDLHGMDLDDFHLSFTFGTGQDFAFLYFVFIDVDFSCAFRTSDHVENLLENGWGKLAAGVLYNAKRARREAGKIR
jgi:hypothetical protein